MYFCKLLPRPLAVCFVLSFFAAAANAQQPATRPRQATETAQTTAGDVRGRAGLENDLVVVETAPDDAVEPDYAVPGFGGPARLGAVELSMLSAIEERLGTPYRLGATGPYRYDCSGFVWSVFQQAGVAFERSTARNFWHGFMPPAEGEKYKFGTLVFFNNLQHVGIVVDEQGFYHASTSRGVVYSRFDDYWTKRITGFRRVPMAQSNAFIASSGR